MDKFVLGINHAEHNEKKIIQFGGSMQCTLLLFVYVNVLNSIYAMPNF